MSDPSNTNDFRQALVAAVQAELARHGASITAELDRIRRENVEDRANLRRELNGQLAELARIVDDVRAHAEADVERVRAAYEARIVEMESRYSRRLDDVTANLGTAVQAAARPVLADAMAEQERAMARVAGLEQQLRKFDEQAARMVTYVTEVIHKVEARQDEVAADLQAQVAAEIGGLRPLVDDIDSSVRRFQSDISTQVSTRLNDAEDRFNTRLMAAEARMKEAAGTQIAEIQAHVGRMSAHIDETLAVLNNRHEKVEARFATTDQRIEELVESVQGVDREALDQMANKVSSAVGEAMLVRIEMERLEKAVNERSDELTVRITEVETQLADATMDVSTAVQLERLEELERAVLELDPTRFSAYDPSASRLVPGEPVDPAADRQEAGTSADGAASECDTAHAATDACGDEPDPAGGRDDAPTSGEDTADAPPAAPEPYLAAPVLHASFAPGAGAAAPHSEVEQPPTSTPRTFAPPVG